MRRCTRGCARRARALHRAIAETYSALPQPDPDVVASHFRRAADPRAAAWLIRAGDRAGRAFAYQTAIERFADALALIGDDPATAATRCELHIRLARLLRTAETPRAVQHAEEAARLAVARFRLGYLYGFIGQQQRGITVQRAALATLDALPEGEMARIAPLDFVCADITARHGSIALRMAQVGRFREAARHAERALAHKAAMTPTSQDAWTAQAIVERAMGRAMGAWEIGRTLSDLARAQEEHDVARTMIGNPLAWAALVFWTDDPGRHELNGLLDEQPPRPGGLFAALPPQTLHLAALYVAGAWAEARQVIAAVRRSRFARHPFLHGVWLVHALIATAQGEAEAAWQVVRATLPDGAATEPGDTQFDAAVTMQRIAATLALDAGDHATAREWLEAHDRWMAWSGIAPGLTDGYLLWARYHRDAGDTARAAECAADALAAAQDPRQPLTLLAAHRLVGELHGAAGGWEAAARAFADALTVAAACDCPYEQVGSLLAWAEKDTAARENAAAEQSLARARDLAAPLGARPLLARMHVLAARLGRAVEKPRADVVGITEREDAVLRLIAEGLSNREIAARLNLSARTVERHISNIYTKIAVENCAGAVSFAVRHGIF